MNINTLHQRTFSVKSKEALETLDEIDQFEKQRVTETSKRQPASFYNHLNTEETKKYASKLKLSIKKLVKGAE